MPPILRTLLPGQCTKQVSRAWSPLCGARCASHPAIQEFCWALPPRWLPRGGSMTQSRVLSGLRHRCPIGCRDIRTLQGCAGCKASAKDFHEARQCHRPAPSQSRSPARANCRSRSCRTLGCGVASDCVGRLELGNNSLFEEDEAAIYSELGLIDRADALFSALAAISDASTQLRRVRHLLRSARFQEAVAAIEPWLDRPNAYLFWPYASAAWRIVGDPRSDWLEGDNRIVGV